MKRYFEFVGNDAVRGVENSSKFWEAWVDGDSLQTRFGKIGGKGQTTVKAFSSGAEAEAALEKAVLAKLNKGYVEKQSAEDDAVASDLSVVEQVQAELARCEAKGTSAEELNSLLDTHEGCTDWEDRCPICTYLADDDQDMPDELWGENLFVALSRRTDLTAEQQDRIVNAATGGAPMDVHLAEILPNLADYSARISHRAKEVILAPVEFVSSGIDDDYESWALDLLEKIKTHHSFSPTDIKQFVESHKTYGFDFDEEEESTETVDESVGPVCSKCGRDLPAGARFCAQCGGEAVSASTQCSQCDEELEPSARFCGSCGTQVDAEESAPESEQVAAIAKWMMDAIQVLPRNKKVRRLDFLAGAESTLVFSIEFSGEDFDVRLHKKLLDLETLIGPGYRDFTDEDPVEPKLYLHAYWADDDFEELGPEIMEDIVRMVDSHEWVRSTTISGVMREKTELERWI